MTSYIDIRKIYISAIIDYVSEKYKKRIPKKKGVVNRPLLKIIQQHIQFL